jgi:hypothetical protein
MLSSFYFIQRMHNYIFQQNIKIYMKINIKSAPTGFGLNNRHQGTPWWWMLKPKPVGAFLMLILM